MSLLNQPARQVWPRLLFILILAVAFVLPGSLSAAPADGALWSDVAESSFAAAGMRGIVPTTYRTLALNQVALRALLAQAPLEGSTLADGLLLSLPLPDGSFARFRVVESPIMAPELAAKFPEIKTYTGQGLDDPTATVRFDWTPAGFHAQILSAAGRFYIDPYSRNDTGHYISYDVRHLTPPSVGFREAPPSAEDLARAAEIAGLVANSPHTAVGPQLLTYRLAVAATGEYTQYFGGTVALAMAQIVTVVNRVDGVFEKEIAVRLSLIANNDLIVYTDGNTDPYTNSDVFMMLDENQANLDAVIGSANYDMGHVLGTGPNGGVAILGSICDATVKGKGATGIPDPTGDAFIINFVAHEMGHQAGATHTFNSLQDICGPAWYGPTAYEPGSGSTIMGYPGYCSPDSLQDIADALFHTASFEQMVAYTRSGTGATCGTLSNTGNSAPLPSAGVGGFTIPANTPFTLTGAATDADNDPLTYSWEEYDLGPQGPPNNPANPPFFRSWAPVSDPTRVFPRLSDLVNNTTALGEVLPNVTRALNFHLTVRDNRSGGAGVDYASMAFTVTTAAGPFQVTQPNTAVIWPANSTQTVTWNVANTDQAPVNCLAVDIRLSTDGGLTYPALLEGTTPNDGSQAVTVPDVASSIARVQVSCTVSPILDDTGAPTVAGAKFFDISNVDFIIDQSPMAVGLSSVSASSGTPAWPLLLAVLAAGLLLPLWLRRGAR